MGLDIFPLEEEFLLCRLPLLFMGDGEGLMTNYLPSANQKIPYGLIKVMFLEEVKTAMRSGIRSRFGIRDFKHEQHYFGIVVLSLMKYICFLVYCIINF